MDYIADHLTSLRQEIANLRIMNAQYCEHKGHSPVDTTAFAARQNRLLEIQRELSDMRDCPPDPTVWWDKRRAAQNGDKN